jgi:hypothetical protein
MSHPMRLLSIVISIGVLATCSTCKSDDHKSRVVRFDYSGIGDNVPALLEGIVQEVSKNNNMKDTIVPMENVIIKVEQTNEMVKTDSSGLFSIGVKERLEAYNFIVTKEGYQPIRVTNFVAISDEVSTIEIYLVKGENMQTFEIPKRSAP